jgi:hypothetical protein
VSERRVVEVERGAAGLHFSYPTLYHSGCNLMVRDIDRAPSVHTAYSVTVALTLLR